MQLICLTKLRKMVFLMKTFFLKKRKVKTNIKWFYVLAKHHSGASSINNIKVQFIRNLNFKYGEYFKKFRFIKLKKIFLILSSLSQTKNFVIKNIAYIFGITKFIIYYLREFQKIPKKTNQ